MAIEQAVLRWTVPIDGAWHTLIYAGHIVHVAARRDDIIELWTLANPGHGAVAHRLRVFGTGFLIPVSNYLHWGTAFTDGGALVWHLIEDFSMKGDDD